MAQRAGRIVCPKCGANNFDTVSACWRCNAPLGAGFTAPAAASPAPTAGPMPTASSPTMADRVMYQAAPAVMTGTGLMGNPSAANRAAFWLGILMPYFGFPIGLAFMMCDDRRRQEVGRRCLLWSTIGGVVHLLLLVVSLLGMREYIAMAFGALKSQAGRAGGMGADSGGM